MSVPALKPAGYPLKSIDREAFRDFLSNEIFERLDEEGVEAIGAFEEEEGGETSSAGVLVFSVKNDQEISASVQWLYVGVSYRGQGISDGLMERMFDLLSFLGEYSLTCNIPEDPEYDGLSEQKQGRQKKFSKNLLT